MMSSCKKLLTAVALVCVGVVQGTVSHSMVETAQTTIVMTPQGQTSPKLSFLWHAHVDTSMKSHLTMQEFHSELNIENFDVTGWPTTGDNKVYTAVTWYDAAEDKSDGVLCTLTVT